MKLNPQSIQAEMQKLAGNTPVKVKINRQLDIAQSIWETDDGVTVILNPTRIRSPRQLEEHLKLCRETVTNNSV